MSGPHVEVIAEHAAANVGRPPVALFSGPLRMMALLAAHNVPGIGEWHQLKTAMAAASAAGWPITLSLLVGEELLFDRISSEIAASSLTNVTVAPMPHRTEQLAIAMNRFLPHVLHVFAPGSAAYGAPALQMAHFGDGGAGRSNTLSLAELTRFRAMRSVWLVVLACCDSGGVVPEPQSMARRLVADGVPAALGAHAPPAADARALCGAFYGSLFEHLADRLRPLISGGYAEIDWSRVLHVWGAALTQPLASARLPHPSEAQTQPVLFVRPEPFLVAAAPPMAPGVRAVPPVPDVVRRTEIVAGFLRTLPPEAPLALRLQALALLDDVPAVIRPDSQGTFGLELTSERALLGRELAADPAP